MPFHSRVSSDPTPTATPVSPVEAEPVPAQAETAADDSAADTLAPIWLQRLSLFVLVLFCVYLGVLVMILPWWSRVWDHNQFFEARPALATVMHAGAMRGLISGLGLLDIWIGVSEAVHYRDHRP